MLSNFPIVRLEKEIETPSARSLYSAIGALKTAREIKMFLRDLCTINELKSMSERWAIAQLLVEGLSYRQISKKIGVSTVTVTRVAHWLHHGKSGYAVILQRRGKKVGHSAPPRRGRRSSPLKD